MSDNEAAVFKLYELLAEITPVDQLSQQSVRESNLSGYVLLDDSSKNGAVYRFTWDGAAQERIVVFRRVQRDGTDGKRLAARITFIAAIGDDVHLRETSKKEGSPHYRSYGKLAAAFTCPKKLPLVDAMNVLKHIERQRLQEADSNSSASPAAR